MKILLFVATILLSINFLFAQRTTYYSFEQALVNDNVRSIEEDINGNVWLGTIGGITKFDGTSFTSYTTADGLGGNIIYDICAHSSGDVYAATSGGLSKFNGSVWTNQGLGDGLPSNTIWCVEEDNSGNIWIGTSAVGAAYFDGSDWTIYNTSNGMVSNGIKTILVDRSDNVFFGTGNGISLYNGSVFKNFNTASGMPGLIVNEIIQLYDGKIAVATNGGIGIYNYYNWTNITTAQGLPAANVLSIQQDSEQKIWVGTSQGLSKYNNPGFTTYNYDSGLTNIITNKILVTNDADNKIWCGSPFNGVTVFDSNNQFIIYRTNKNLVDDEVTTVYTDDDDITWVGTKAGLNRVDDLHWRTYRTAEGLANNEITAIHKDINGNVWIGTINGLSKLNGATITTINTAQGLTNSYINSITSDPTGVVYVATADKVTVITGGVVSDTIGTTEGLVDNNVKQVQYENGRIWYLTNAAIQYYNGATYIDATLTGCAELQTEAGAKCLNSSLGQYFGTNYSLRFFDIDNTTANCVLHPYAGTVSMTSAIEIGPGIICSFDNGEVQTFNGGWTAFPVIFDVSFLSTTSDQNYIWAGSWDMGLAKICINCSSDIAATLTAPTCYGSSNGIVTITAPVGSQYSDNNGENWQASANFNAEKGGYKHLLVKNAFGHIIADSVVYLPHYYNITDANITITQILCNGSNSGGILLNYSEPASHTWENLNTVILNRTNLNAGTYSVTVVDNSGCNRILGTQIIEPAALDVDLTFEHISCFGADDGSVSLTVTGGTLPYTYAWNIPGSTATISGLAPATYSYTVTDGNGCSLNGSQLITEPTQLAISEIITNNDCSGDTNGSIDISATGGTAPLTIVWSAPLYENAQHDIIGAPAGFYSVTVTDQNNCVATESYEITEPDGIDIISEDLLHVHCYGESTGEIDIEVSGGFGILSYEWVKQGSAGTFSTNQDLTDLAQGIYHLTITDENSCATNTSYQINQSPDLVASIDVTPITCAGYDDGQMLASAVGGSGIYSAYYYYNEADEIIGVQAHITGLTAGDYYLVIRDSYYCYDTAYASLIQAVPHVYEISSTDMTCNGLNNGTISVTIDGGSGAGFDFVWEAGIAGNTNIANNVAAGNWSVTITDPTDCTEILSAEVDEPAMQDIGEFDEYGYICYGNTLILNPGWFTSYEWSTGATTPTLEVENEDLYYVEVVNEIGCHFGDTIQVIVSTVFNDESINLASVTDDGTIKVMWEKTAGEGTELYNLYRDAGDGYEHISSLPFNNPAIYEDTDVSPSSEYYSYKISSVDSCGSESDYSEHHRTCLLNIVPDDNGACWLNWGEYQGFFVVYYFIMRGTTPDNLVVVDSVLYNDFNYVEMNPNVDGSYYRIMVRRIDGCSPGDGNYYDEAFSNIVFCDNYVGMVNTAIMNPEVYPNPFYNEINIGFYLQIPGEIKYSVVNLLGQTVIEEETYTCKEGNQTISFNSNIDAGIYVLRLSYGTETHNIRIVKN
jgi:hypothetical protein